MKRFAALERQVNQLDETVWAKEIMAQRFESIWTKLGDDLRRNDDKVAVLSNFTFEKLLTGTPRQPQKQSAGIEIVRFDQPDQDLSPNEWRKFVQKLQKDGYRLDQVEFHLAEFEVTPDDIAHSVIAIELHISNSERQQRCIMKGDLNVSYQKGSNEFRLPIPATVNATKLELLKRTGVPAFTEAIAWSPPRDLNKIIDPLMLYDLNGDGLSEIILGGANRVYWNLGGGKFQSAPLLKHPPTGVQATILADFTGDGFVDLLCADPNGIVLFAGTQDGHFDESARRVWTSPSPLLYASVMTAGDVDGDGRLDLWIAQYKPPYVWGQMPTPYYDANDGFPSFLLINDGRGNFHDGTVLSGLAEKRFRRTYSASFVDVDDDGDLDLLVVSDFYGVDLYFNDGHGHFTNMTETILDEPHLFGMAHCFGDWDSDGKLDVFVIGMNSFVGHRLDSMNISPPDFPEYKTMRPKFDLGSRMYLSRYGGLRQLDFSDQLVQTGWAWGVTAFDADNDGDLDIYVANGHKTFSSATDYEPKFWCHDIYLANSTNDPAMELYFGSVANRHYGEGGSYGGFAKNVLFLNEGGRSFINVAYLMGVAMEQDCRNVASDDLDGDGKLDLLVTSWENWRSPRPTLHIFKNQWPESGSWIAFRLREGTPSIGVKITLHTSVGDQIRWIVTGDSYRSQHANTAHFGLGKLSAVTSVEVRWPNGTTKLLTNPSINCYHDIGGAK